MLWTTFTLPHAYAAPIAAGPALCRIDLPPCDCGAEYGVIVTCRPCKKQLMATRDRRVLHRPRFALTREPSRTV